MTIVVKKKNSVSYVLKIAVSTVGIFVAVGLIAHFTKKTEPEKSNNIHSVVLGRILEEKGPSLIPTLKLNVPKDAAEKAWSAALATAIGGKTEVRVEHGRADVITDKYAVEVDFISKWKEGVGQALSYGNDALLVPVLALIVIESPEEELIKTIDKLCVEKGIKLIFLAPEL